MLTIPVHVIKQREAKGGTFTSYKRRHITDYYIVLLYYSKELNFSRKKKKEKKNREKPLFFIPNAYFGQMLSHSMEGNVWGRKL